jgi:hypothetical protein
MVGLTAAISNDAPEPANHAVIRFYVDTRLTIVSKFMTTHPMPETFTYGRQAFETAVLYMTWSVPPRLPIWAGEPFRVTDSASDLLIGMPPKGEGSYIIGWQVTSPRMEPKSGFYRLASTGNRTHLTEI